MKRSLGDKVGLSAVMMVCTALYMACIVLFVIILNLWPMLKKRLHRKKMAKQLTTLGLHPVSQATLYQKPKGMGFKAVATDSEFRPWILVQERFRRWQEEDHQKEDWTSHPVVATTVRTSSPE